MIIYKKGLLNGNLTILFSCGKNENKYEKASDYFWMKMETIGNKYFQKVPFGGKKL